MGTLPAADPMHSFDFAPGFKIREIDALHKNIDVAPAPIHHIGTLEKR